MIAESPGAAKWRGANCLSANGYDDAAASLREGLEETLTALKLEPARPAAPVLRDDQLH